MIIEIDIFGSKEVDYKPNKTKQKRRKNDTYDQEDSLFDNQDYENAPIELEPELKNFFVFAGVLPDEPKKVLQQYRLYKKDKWSQKIKKSEDNAKSENPDDESTKIKYTFKDEYRIKNEILVRSKTDFNETDLFEFFVNHLIYEENTTAEICCKKLSFKDTEILNKQYLQDKLDELQLMFDIEMIKFTETIQMSIFNDDFLEILLNIFDLYVKKYYLSVFLANKKPFVEKTVKKHIKALINEKIDDKREVYKNWSIKMHIHKKNMFFNKNKHFLNSSLLRSELFESKE